MTNFDTRACNWHIPLSEETLKSHIESGKKICVDSDSNDDEPGEEENTVNLLTIRAGIQMVNELRQFAQNSLSGRHGAFHIFEFSLQIYFFEQMLCINTLFVE